VKPVREPEEIAGSDAPIVATEEVPDCDLCGGTDREPHAEGYDYELLTCRNRWRFVRCKACGHVWLDPRPAVEALATIYPPHYYAYQYAKQVHPLAARAKAWFDRRKLGGVLRALGRVPDGYLDVGCGDGRFLRVLERAGVPRHRLYGLELDAGSWNGCGRTVIEPNAPGWKARNWSSRVRSTWSRCST